MTKRTVKDQESDFSIVSLDQANNLEEALGIDLFKGSGKSDVMNQVLADLWKKEKQLTIAISRHAGKTRSIKTELILKEEQDDLLFKTQKLAAEQTGGSK